MTSFLFTNLFKYDTIKLVIVMSKKKEKSKKAYCVFCGTINDNTLEKCIKCKKELHPKNHLFRDFLYSHIKDELKDKLEDNIFSYLKNYIISHLYGIVMTVSVIFTAVTVVTSLTAKSYRTISDVSEINTTSNNTGEVTITISTYDDMCSNDFDPKLVNVPFATAGTISGLKRTLEVDILKKGQTIDEWCSENGSVILCVEELMIYDKGIEKITNKYREKVLAYADWVKTNNIGNDEYADKNYELEMLMHDIFVYDKMKKVNINEKINKSVELYVPEVGCTYD